MLGCVAESERLPPGPGGGGGGSMTGGSGGGGGPAQGGDDLVTGRVCRILDLSNPATCAPATDLSGIVIAERGGTARSTTAEDGSFALAAPLLGDAVVLEAAPGPVRVVPSVLAVQLDGGRAEVVLLPMVDSTAWAGLLMALDA